MIVKNYIAKFNDNDCKNIINNIETGLSTYEAIKLIMKKNRHNPNRIKGIEYKDDKYFWIFKMLEMEMNEIQCVQSC